VRRKSEGLAFRNWISFGVKKINFNCLSQVSLGKREKMAISSKVKRLLLSRSGGYCGNPECQSDLFPFFENRSITNVEELAHIIGQKKGGPRGDNDMPLNDRDEYDNIILLCPTCHRKIDKNPDLYPDSIVKKWKEEHEIKIKNLFQEQQYSTRGDAREEIEKLLNENKAIFDLYGPFSEFAQKPCSDAHIIWNQKSIETIIPNNRRIVKLLESNYHLLNEEEKKVFEVFKIHRDGFEFNKLSGDKNSSVILFPQELKRVFSNGK